jgi:2'-hydroxyisoflavone reductase
MAQRAVEGPMSVLILGGTRFVGRHIADALIARGYCVTLFNRGHSNPPVHADLEQIRGDRTTDLHRIGDRKWDAVIDTSGYTPDVVERSTRYFADRTHRYLFISTISVYDEAQTDGPDEDARLHVLPRDADPTEFNVEYYGALKALCEAVVRSTFRHRASIVRPGLVAGPYDPTDRFTYWPVRVDAGGEILAPPSAAEPIQYIDVRDLAEFCAHLLKCDDGGTYNCVTPAHALTFGDLFDACARVSSSAPEYVWADAEFLQQHEVNPWSDFPLWIPATAVHRHIQYANANRALVRGLQIRPLLETVRDTLVWARATGKRLGALSNGLTPEREAQLLREFADKSMLDRAV